MLAVIRRRKPFSAFRQTRAQFESYGVMKDGKLQQNAYGDSYDAEEYAKRCISASEWVKGVSLKVVKVQIVYAGELNKYGT